MEISLSTKLQEIIPVTESCLIIGDLNICSSKEPNHEVHRILRAMEFHLLVSEPTHFLGGHIDQAWVRYTTYKATIQIYSPYYNCKDDDALLFTLYDTTTEQGDIIINEQFVI